MSRSRFLSLIVIFVVVFSATSCNFPSNKNNSGPSLQENQTFQSLESASVTLSNTGGEITLEGANVTLEGISSSEGSIVTLEMYDSTLLADEINQAEGNGFLLKDIPDSFSGIIKVQLTIPENVLKEYEKGKGKGTLFLQMGTYAYAPSSEGTKFDLSPYHDATIDIEEGSITAEFDFSKPLVYNSPSKFAKPGRPGFNADILSTSWWESTPRQMLFKVTYGLYELSTRADIFNITWSNKHDYVGGVVDMLLESKRLLEEDDMGFVLDQELNVYVKNCDTRDSKFSVGTIGFGEIKECDGQFAVKYGGLSVYMTINPRLLAAGKENELKATIAHELMHYAQYLVYKDYPEALSFESIDEASAVWFESYALNNNNWMSPLADQQKDFIYTPWLFDPNFARSGGYGASWFIDDIATYNSAAVIREAYSSDNKNGLDAWRNGITRATGIDYSDAFRSFLQEYLLNPSGLSTDLGNLASFGELNDQRIMITYDNNTFAMNFEPIGSLKSSVKPKLTTGKLYAPGEVNTPPSITITRSLNAFNGFMVIVGFPSNIHEDMQASMPLSISVSGSDPERTGVMIYGLGAESSLSGAVGINDYVSPILAGKSTTIESFGAEGGDAQFNRIAIIMFNDNWTKLDASPLSVTISYGSSEREYTGDAYATEWKYDANACFVEESCFPPYNPPACYQPPYLTGGVCTDCGMGEGNNTTLDFPCAIQLPEWCYSSYDGCTACSGGRDFTLFGSYGSQAFLINKLVKDSNGLITFVELQWIDVIGEPTITGDQDNFTATFSVKDSTGEAKGTLTMTGSLSDTGGGGSWSLSHECTGENTVTGTWDVTSNNSY